jgi:hypothetical protein
MVLGIDADDRSVRPPVFHSASGWTTESAASRSSLFHASIAKRTVSTFSLGIAERVSREPDRVEE